MFLLLVVFNGFFLGKKKTCYNHMYQILPVTSSRWCDGWCVLLGFIADVDGLVPLFHWTMALPLRLVIVIHNYHFVWMDLTTNQLVSQLMYLGAAFTIRQDESPLHLGSITAGFNRDDTWPSIWRWLKIQRWPDNSIRWLSNLWFKYVYIYNPLWSVYTYIYIYTIDHNCIQIHTYIARMNS